VRQKQNNGGFPEMRLFRLTFTVLALTALTAGVFAADQKTVDLYKSKCQGCHGPDGKATAIGKKLGARDFQDPDVVKMSEADLVKITEDGKNKMPPYKGKLTDDQIKALAQYIKEMK
jgi:mono/diheme cytochrome c family protein